MQTSKSWNGLYTTQDELESILASNSSIQEKIVKGEPIYYQDTHKPEVIARPDLFSLNKITHEERLENFLILLSDGASWQCISEKWGCFESYKRHFDRESDHKYNSTCVIRVECQCSMCSDMTC